MLRILLVAIVMTCIGCRGKKDTYANVVAEVHQALPLGMRADDVGRVLDSLGIAHSLVQPDSSTMRALAGPIEKGLVTRADVQFELTFDSSGRLTSISEEKILTGP